MRLATVVVKEHTGRTMHLIDDNALGAVDNKRAVVGHQWQVAHVDVLLAHFFDFFVLGRAVFVVNDQTHGDAQRRAVAHATQLTFIDIKLGVAELIAHVFQRRIA